MRLLTDVTPLREYPAFRRLWLGGMLSSTGSAMTTFAVTLQVYDLTRSTAAVGGIGVATFLPLLLITLPGGTLADRVDRRRLVLAMSLGSAALSAALFGLTASAARRCGRSTRSSRRDPRAARSAHRRGGRSSRGWCRGISWRRRRRSTGSPSR